MEIIKSLADIYARVKKLEREVLKELEMELLKSLYTIRHSPPTLGEMEKEVRRMLQIEDKDLYEGLRKVFNTRRVVALVAHSNSTCGLALLDMLKIYEGKSVGMCKIIDGLAGPLALLSQVERGELFLVGCCMGYEQRCGDLLEYRPAAPEEIGDIQKLLKEIYEGLAGSIDVESIAASLRVLYGERFWAVKISCEDNCVETVSKMLFEICGAP
ncbi:MAG: hypothetical protein ACK4SY_10310 [Pyrobaculum sp.]